MYLILYSGSQFLVSKHLNGVFFVVFCTSVPLSWFCSQHL